MCREVGLECIWVFWDPILEKGMSDRVTHQWYRLKERWNTSRLSILTIALSLTSLTFSAAICRRMSPTLKSTGVDHLGAKFGKKEVDRCKPNFNAIWKRHGAVIAKKLCRYLLLFEHNART